MNKRPWSQATFGGGSGLALDKSLSGRNAKNEGSRGKSSA